MKAVFIRKDGHHTVAEIDKPPPPILRIRTPARNWAESFSETPRSAVSLPFLEYRFLFIGVEVDKYGVWARYEQDGDASSSG